MAMHRDREQGPDPGFGVNVVTAGDTFELLAMPFDNCTEGFAGHRFHTESSITEIAL
jgi:hypothetical protein